jgi:hypothetical protein
MTQDVLVKPSMPIKNVLNWVVGMKKCGIVITELVYVLKICTKCMMLFIIGWKVMIITQNGWKGYSKLSNIIDLFPNINYHICSINKQSRF